MVLFQSMLRHHAFFKSALLSISLMSASALANPIWHCSRSDVQIANAADDFSLAALSAEREVIRLSLCDLYNVYQGTPVKLSGGFALSACVVSNDAVLTTTAMRSIGKKIPFAAQESKGAESNIKFVADESAMLNCIDKNQPAIGYLSKATHTEAVGPCF
jgi:hypothetical protein